MFKVTGASMSLAGALALAFAIAAPAGAYAQRKTIENDLSQCAQGNGPSVLVEVSGFRGATGTIRVQSYPATRNAWLEKGAWINRIETGVRPVGGKMRFCVPLPAAGSYGIAVRHDRNGNGKTDLSQDGGGFSNNPKASIFNLGKPAVDKAAIAVGNAPVVISISLQYM